MAAVACLRVMADDAAPAQSAALAGIIAKVTDAFLESRWVWPRRHGQVGRSAFLLVDPRALEFDADELRALAGELQIKLFGVEGEGEVNLLLFEGDREDITRFATCGVRELEAALAGEPGAQPLNGRIRRVTPKTIETVPHKGDPEAEASHAAASEAARTAEALVERLQQAEPAADNAAAAVATPGFHAVYYAPRQNVIGSAISDGRLGASSLRGIFGNGGHIQGEAARRYDMHCLDIVLSLVDKPFAGLLFLPISFSAIVHRPTRELYQPILAKLPPERRGQLATSVYDVPRDPSFTALSQLKAFLGQYFGFIDLGVTDPGFRVEKLTAGMVNSVTLLVTEADQKARLASIRRFMDNRENYKRQKIWPAISHIRAKAELDFCVAQRAPFLSGPAVSDMLDAPADASALSPDHLPLRRGDAPIAHCA